jgi:hypothetical protein
MSQKRWLIGRLLTDEICAPASWSGRDTLTELREQAERRRTGSTLARAMRRRDIDGRGFTRCSVQPTCCRANERKHEPEQKRPLLAEAIRREHRVESGLPR